MSRRPPVIITLVTAVAIASIFLPATPSAAAERVPQAETQAQRDARMQWWREARFGMFIHWGLYAVPAGIWRDKKIDGTGEWIMNSADIPIPEYEALAGKFNPMKFDPEEWARITQEAGVKYLVITSKHHDGFCLFGSKATDYNIQKASTWAKDLLVPLAKACRARGIRFCTYYSIMDWHHPAQAKGSEKQYNPTRIVPGRKAEYMAFMKAQLKEILLLVDTEVLWFDGEWCDWYTEEDGREVYAYLRALKPSLIINNRVGKGRQGMEGFNKGDREYVGDFGTPEQEIPATGFPGVDWESCMTMNDTWGFKSWDGNWKSAQTLVRNIIDTASKGGNYLLNVGPTAEGLIPAPSVERLQAVGAWMRVNGPAIHSTSASPFPALPWGRATRNATAGGTTLYLHVFDWPAGGKLLVPGLRSPVRACSLLADPQKKALPCAAGDGGITVSLPQAPPDPSAYSTTVVLEIQGEPLIGAAPAAGASAPRFQPVEKGEFRFDTGVLRGILRPAGRSLGLSSLIHIPTGTSLAQGNGLFSHYRVFTEGKRYGGGAWDWPSEAKLRDDGSVEVRWPAAEGRPFDLWAVYHWSGPAALDLETGVRAKSDLKGFESFLASYFDQRFNSSMVYVKKDNKSGFLAADPALGTWLMAPRDAAAVRTIQDGRWKLDPNPVDWVILPALDRPIGVRRDGVSGVTAIAMARPEDCFTIATPHQIETHYSLYLSLFGRDLKGGEEARARTRLVVAVSPKDAEILEAYEAFLKDARRP